MGVAVDREAPFYFTKSAEHCVPSGSTVPYPPGTNNYHYELELVAVMGVAAFRVSAERLPSRTSAIRPRSITTLPPTMGRSPTQSMTFALVITSRSRAMALM